MTRNFPQPGSLPWGGILVVGIVLYLVFRAVSSGQIGISAKNVAPTAVHASAPTDAEFERMAAAAARKAVAEEKKKANAKKKDTRLDCARLSPRARRAAHCPETAR